MIYVTIIICTLLIAATVVAWKYFSRDITAEAVLDAQLDNISIVCSTLKDRYIAYDEAPEEEKEKYKIPDSELRDAIENIYTMSTRCYEPDNK